VKEFDGIVSPLIEAVLNNSNENVTLAEIRNNLLPRLLSGEVHLKDAEQIALGAM
jgi:type I restriction enzyme S subunit